MSLNNYIVGQWERLFGAIPIKEGVVADIMPGDDPKIEIALQKSGFYGRVVLVDLDVDAMKRLKTSIGELGETIDVSCLNVLECATKSDYSVANHPLDDIVFYDFCRKNGINPKMLSDNVEISRGVWGDICKNPEESFKIARKFFTSMLDGTSAGGYTVISSYQSRFEREHGFHHETDLCRMIMEELSVRSLNLEGVENKTPDYLRVLNPDASGFEQWLVLRKTG